MEFDKLLDDWPKNGIQFTKIHNYLQRQIDIYKEEPEELKSRMKKLVRIFNFKKKVNEYKYDHDDDKYNLWENAFKNVFSPGPNITDNDFDKKVKPVIDKQGWLSGFKEGVKAKAKSTIKGIGYNQIPLRL